MKKNKENHTKKAEEPKSEGKKPKLSYDELLDLLQRTQANLENYRKQNEKRIDEVRDFVKRDVILKFIPVMDNFDLAMKGIPDDTSLEIKEGMDMIQKQLHSTLNDLSVEKISTNGDFNPLLHEALSKIPSEIKEGEILNVFQPGYKMHGKVLRAARVQVSAGKQEDVEEETTKN